VQLIDLWSRFSLLGTIERAVAMIEYKTGDILATDAEALVNTVNCVGIMGRGIALQFKKAFPANFNAYQAACKRSEVQPGRMFVFETRKLTNPRYIINFPTKRHWRGASRLSDIESGLAALVREIKSRRIRSIALPPLGSGLGGLDWTDVRRAVEKALAPLEDVTVTVFEPNGAPDTAVVRNKKVPSMTPGRAALVGLIDRYLAGLLDPSVSLLEAHKLMYFMQEAGEPLRLRYVKALYGPYAENLRHVLHAVEGHLVTGYADGGDAPGKELTLIPGAVTDAQTFLEAHSETRHRLDRVAALVEGFESPFGLELLSTVHWVASRESVRTADAVVEHTYAWGDRKRQFSQRQIRLAIDVLGKKLWLPPDLSHQAI
jgi:O-acetyl-ADP-ribose deacetylase (regulator of RNase III)